MYFVLLLFTACFLMAPVGSLGSLGPVERSRKQCQPNGVGGYMMEWHSGVVSPNEHPPRFATNPVVECCRRFHRRMLAQNEKSELFFAPQRALRI